MHVMSGPEAAREMRKIGYLGPIIGVTGDADTEEFLASGADMVQQESFFFYHDFTLRTLLSNNLIFVLGFLICNPLTCSSSIFITTYHILSSVQ